jgi:diguanylate cyclase (GGDEF)-like protein
MAHDALLPVSQKILVIDDEGVGSLTIGPQSTTERIEIFEASNGPTGLATAILRQPNLILLELNLPGWEGFETLRQLQDHPRTRTIPVILISSSASTRDKARGLDEGAVDFILKPLDPIELRARIRVALRNKYLQDLLEKRAHLDGLTGLGNRHALGERLHAEWEVSRRRNAPLALVISDLDHFKSINDTYGHAAGDDILCRTAELLRQIARAGDFVARYGGEEFVILAPDCDLEGGIQLAERFRREVSELDLGQDGRRLFLTTSVGVACSTYPFLREPDEILSCADRALYEAKASGRNRVATLCTENLLGPQRVFRRVESSA